MTEQPVMPSQEGIRGRDGGPYLDEVEAYREEQTRAFREQRDINFNNIYSGPHMVDFERLPDNVNSNPGSVHTPLLHRFQVLERATQQTSNPANSQEIDDLKEKVRNLEEKLDSVVMDKSEDDEIDDLMAIDTESETTPPVAKTTSKPVKKTR